MLYTTTLTMAENNRQERNLIEFQMCFWYLGVIYSSLLPLPEAPWPVFGDHTIRLQPHPDKTASHRLKHTLKPFVGYCGPLCQHTVLQCMLSLRFFFCFRHVKFLSFSWHVSMILKHVTYQQTSTWPSYEDGGYTLKTCQINNKKSYIFEIKKNVILDLTVRHNERNTSMWCMLPMQT